MFANNIISSLFLVLFATMINMISNRFSDKKVDIDAKYVKQMFYMFLLILTVFCLIDKFL
jgi:cytochrome c biogenesis factor